MVDPVKKTHPTDRSSHQIPHISKTTKNMLPLPSPLDLPDHLPTTDKTNLATRKKIAASVKKNFSGKIPHVAALQLLLDQKSISAKVELIKELLQLLK